MFYESCNSHECSSKDDFRDTQCMLAVKQAIELNSFKLIGFENDNLNSWKAFYSHGRLNANLILIKKNPI